MKVPFSLPYSSDSEIAYVTDAVRSPIHQGDGEFTEKASNLLCRITGSPKHLLTSSCTSALEICALMLDLKLGDEVIMPSFTFVSTANAFVLHGGTPVFVDIEQRTKCLDLELVEKAISPRTVAVVAVNYAGVSCDLRKLRILCDAHGLILIEDAAQSIFAKYDGQPLGSFGHLAAFSFHATKNISCGEGGALAINDEAFFERAEIIREKGTNRAMFLNGQVDKYTWVDKGSSYLMSDLSAALLLAQLEQVSAITRGRLKAWSHYHTCLSGQIPADVNFVDSICEHNAHMFYIMVKDIEQRDDLLGYCRGRGVQATFHYVPLHSSPAGKKFCRTSGDLAVTDETFQRLVRLPLYVGVDTTYVSSCIIDFYCR